MAAEVGDHDEPVALHADQVRSVTAEHGARAGERGQPADPAVRAEVLAPDGAVSPAREDHALRCGGLPCVQVGLAVAGVVAAARDDVVARPAARDGRPGAECGLAGAGMQPQRAGLVPRDHVRLPVAVQVPGADGQVVAAPAGLGEGASEGAGAVAAEGEQPAGRDLPGDEVVVAVAVEVADGSDLVVGGEGRGLVRRVGELAVAGASAHAGAAVLVPDHQVGLAVPGEVGAGDHDVVRRPAGGGGHPAGTPLAGCRRSGSTKPALSAVLRTRMSG